MESIQHMVQEARAVRNKVAAKHFKPNNMIFLTNLDLRAMFVMLWKLDNRT